MGGESTDANPRWSTRALAALAWEVVESMEWTTCIIVGHSLGAMVATHMADDLRADRAILIAPSAGLRPCLRSGFLAHSLRTIIVLIWCALLLCRLDAAASQSDLNLSWLLHGLECRSMSHKELEMAVEAFTPRPEAPAGLRVWLRRRLGDVAALVSILRHKIPDSRQWRCNATVLQGSGDNLVCFAAARLTASLWPTKDYHET